MNVAEYLKEDWLCRLPNRIHNMKFKGSSRPAFTVLCLMYYSVKSLVVLYVAGIFLIYKFLLWDLWKLLFLKVRAYWKRNGVEFEYDDEEENEDEKECEQEAPDVNDDNTEEDIQFCQLFTLGDHMSLLIDHIEMCPDETAFIRVVDDEGYTPIYKRKVRRDKNGNRFIVFNNTNLYLIDEKTKPIITKK